MHVFTIIILLHYFYIWRLLLYKIYQHSMYIVPNFDWGGEGLHATEFRTMLPQAVYQKMTYLQPHA